jgi:hypothetical protein
VCLSEREREEDIETNDFFAGSAFFKSSIEANTDVVFIQGLNFISVLRDTFLYEIVLRSFAVLTVCVCDFVSKRIISKKLLVKMLAKLTIGDVTVRRFCGQMFFFAKCFFAIVFS